MKRIFTLSLALLFGVSALMAQVTVVESQITESETDQNTTVTSITTRESSQFYANNNYAPAPAPASSIYDRPMCGLEFDYVMSDTDGSGANSLGGALLIGFLALGGEYYATEADGITSTSWNASLGINKRIYFIDCLFLDLRIGSYMQNTSVESDGSDPETDKWYGLYASPRLCLKLIDNLGITAGYKWHFDKFEFVEDKSFTTMSLGISFLF